MILFISSPIFSVPIDELKLAQQQINTGAQTPVEDSKKNQPDSVQQDTIKTITDLATGVQSEVAERSGSDSPVVAAGNQPDDLSAGADANPTNAEGASDLETANTFWGGYGGYGGLGGYYRRPSYGYGGWGSGWRRGYGDYGYGGGWGWRGRGLSGSWGWGSPSYWYY